MSSNSTATSGSGSGDAGARAKVKTKKVKIKHKEEEAIELPKVLDYLFEKELINRQNKHIHIMDTFGPCRNSEYIFYLNILVHFVNKYEYLLRAHSYV